MRTRQPAARPVLSDHTRLSDPHRERVAHVRPQVQPTLCAHRERRERESQGELANLPPAARVRVAADAAVSVRLRVQRDLSHQAPRVRLLVPVRHLCRQL